MADDFKRQTAYLCTSQQILDGEYVKQEGWEPNYMVTSLGMLSRVRMAGIIVEQSSAMQFAMDDGSGTIGLRFFDPQSVPQLNIGDPVIIIGRPRDVGNERFIIVEIAKKLSSPSKLKEFHEQRKELEKYIPQAPKRAVQDRTPVVKHNIDVIEDSSSDDMSDNGVSVSADTPVEEKKVNKAQLIVQAIRELDPGDGASTEDVLAKVNFPDAEEKLTFLINEGEVFELRAGKVKVLE